MHFITFEAIFHLHLHFLNLWLLFYCTMFKVKWQRDILKTYCFRLGVHKYSCKLDTIPDFIFDFSPLEFSRSMRYKSFQKLLGVQTTEAYFTFQFYVLMYTLCANVKNWLKLNCTVMCLAKFFLFFWKECFSKLKKRWLWMSAENLLNHTLQYTQFDCETFGKVACSALRKCCDWNRNALPWNASRQSLSIGGIHKWCMYHITLKGF